MCDLLVSETLADFKPVILTPNTHTQGPQMENLILSLLSFLFQKPPITSTSLSLFTSLSLSLILCPPALTSYLVNVRASLTLRLSPPLIFLPSAPPHTHSLSLFLFHSCRWSCTLKSFLPDEIEKRGKERKVLSEGM